MSYKYLWCSFSNVHCVLGIMSYTTYIYYTLYIHIFVLPFGRVLWVYPSEGTPTRAYWREILFSMACQRSGSTKAHMCLFLLPPAFLRVFSTPSSLQWKQTNTLHHIAASRHGFKETSCDLQFGASKLLYESTHTYICNHCIKVPQCPTVWHRSYT